MKNKLTINVITYNHKQYIAKCLDSLLCQKTDFGYIIRIFDDCSNDGTTEICREYAEKYPDKIQLFTAEKNLGYTQDVLANALRAYKNIETPYFAFIEGDDYRINENGFQMQVDALEKNQNCVFSGAACRLLVDSKLSDEHIHFPEGIISKNTFISNYKTFLFPVISTRVIRTSAIAIDEDEPLKFIRDIDQFYYLLDKGDMYYENKYLSVYRMSGSGLCSGQDVFSQINLLLGPLMYVDSFTKGNYKKNLLTHFFHVASWYFYLEEQKYKKEEIQVQTETNTEKIVELSLKEKRKIKLKRFKHYILPPVLIDLLNTPRDLSRFIRKQWRRKSESSV